MGKLSTEIKIKTNNKLKRGSSGCQKFPLKLDENVKHFLRLSTVFANLNDFAFLFMYLFIFVNVEVKFHRKLQVINCNFILKFHFTDYNRHEISINNSTLFLDFSTRNILKLESTKSNNFFILEIQIFLLQNEIFYDDSYHYHNDPGRSRIRERDSMNLVKFKWEPHNSRGNVLPSVDRP